MQNWEMFVVRKAILLQQLAYYICRVGQYILIAVFYTLLTSLSYLYLASLIRLQKSDTWTLIWLVVGIWIQFNMIFNYTMCVIVKPGTPKDIPYHQISYVKERCKTCSSIKVARSHHCSICNACVLQMDHHCPWIGSCVGHHNRAYFLNFLSYTMLGLVILLRIIDQYMSTEIYWQDIYDQKISDSLFFQVYVFNVTLIVVLGLFSAFHWYLVLYGKTTVQFCFLDRRYTPSKSFKHNLTLIFGTSNPFLIFLPKLNVLKIRGYQWQNIQRKPESTSMIELQIQPINALNQQILDQNI